MQVLGRMKQAMVEHSSSASHSFLLDDDSTLPFVANEILAQMDDKVGGLGVLPWPQEASLTWLLSGRGPCAPMLTPQRQIFPPRCCADSSVHGFGWITRQRTSSNHHVGA